MGKKCKHQTMVPWCEVHNCECCAATSTVTDEEECVDFEEKEE